MAWKRPAVPTVHRIDGSGLPQAGADPARLQSGNRPPSPDRRLARRPVPAAPPGLVLASARLPPPVLEALAIWTHIAGQNPAHAPSPLAFVPSLIHGRGAWYPAGGIAAVPRALNAAAVAAGVEFHLGARVRSIRCEGGRAIGVEADSGKFFG